VSQARKSVIGCVRHAFKALIRAAVALNTSDGRSRRNANEYETLLRWIAAEEGRFQFVPCRVKTNLRADRSTTELLLRAQQRLDWGSWF
jgi:hypothetical protein